jgi:hypothetical protein
MRSSSTTIEYLHWTNGCRCTLPQVLAPLILVLLFFQMIPLKVAHHPTVVLDVVSWMTRYSAMNSRMGRDQSMVMLFTVRPVPRYEMSPPCKPQRWTTGTDNATPKDGSRYCSSCPIEINAPTPTCQPCHHSDALPLASTNPVMESSIGAALQKAQRAEGMKYSNWAGHKPHPWASFWCLVRVSE